MKELCPKSGKPHEYHLPRQGSSIKVCIWCHRFAFTAAHVKRMGGLIVEVPATKTQTKTNEHSHT